MSKPEKSREEIINSFRQPLLSKTFRKVLSRVKKIRKDASKALLYNVLAQPNRLPVMIRIFGDRRSGNCLKVLYAAEWLGLDTQWIDVDIFKGESRTEEFLARNPTGQTPVMELEDGNYLSQSNAILLYLAEGTDLLPDDRYLKARVHEWLFWEQYNHEPSIAVCRSDLLFRGKTLANLDPARVTKGEESLERMQRHLPDRDWFVGDALTVADVSLIAYTRVAAEGGFSLTSHPAVKQWITRTEQALGLTSQP